MWGPGAPVPLPGQAPSPPSAAWPAPVRSAARLSEAEGPAAAGSGGALGGRGAGRTGRAGAGREGRGGPRLSDAPCGTPAPIQTRGGRPVLPTGVCLCAPGKAPPRGALAGPGVRELGDSPRATGPSARWRVLGPQREGGSSQVWATLGPQSVFQLMGGAEPVAPSLISSCLWGGAGSRRGEYPGGWSVTFIL